MSVPIPPTRLAFVGQANYFDLVALSMPTPNIEPTFIDFRSGGDTMALLDRIEEFHPDLIIVFGPQTIPKDVLRELEAVRIGWFTEPIARVTTRSGWERLGTHDRDAPAAQIDLERRFLAATSCDVQQFDRLISHDPLQAETLGLIGPIWRSIPLAVDDRFYRAPTAMGTSPTIGFIGSSTPYREEFLTGLKHHYDLRHFAHGLFGDRLLDELGELEIAINVHNLDISTFENRVSLHLAQGHLVLSQPLAPTNGLEADRDFIEFRTPEELAHIVAEIRAHPRAHELTRHRGRRKAEYFRASTVYERIVKDLRLERVLRVG